MEAAICCRGLSDYRRKNRDAQEFPGEHLIDPDSAKMTSARGVLQGYNGLAVVGDRAQIIVHAEAHGSGSEGHLLAPQQDGTREAFHALDGGKDILARVKVAADSGFHSKTVLAAVEAIGVEAYVADRDYRKREPASLSSLKTKFLMLGGGARCALRAGGFSTGSFGGGSRNEDVSFSIEVSDLWVGDYHDVRLPLHRLDDDQLCHIQGRLHIIVDGVMCRTLGTV